MELFFQAAPPLNMDTPTGDITNSRDVMDWGTVLGVVLSSIFLPDVENKLCDALYSDKAAMKQLKDSKFDLVFSDYMYAAVR